MGAMNESEPNVDDFRLLAILLLDAGWSASPDVLDQIYEPGADSAPREVQHELWQAIRDVSDRLNAHPLRTAFSGSRGLVRHCGRPESPT
jgi:hypothetical protein